MRFAVLKGVQGFGDRLQCLLQAIRYAINTERILVVDWRDTDWTHEATAHGFEAFFRLSGVRSFGLQEFLDQFPLRIDEFTTAHHDRLASRAVTALLIGPP